MTDAAADEVCRAVMGVVEGGMVIPPGIAARYVRIATRVGLSPRERQVLCLAGEGKPNKQIARELSLEVSTVKRRVRA
jgi:DNA-binding NarL/FixJ family response regulator